MLVTRIGETFKHYSYYSATTDRKKILQITLCLRGFNTSIHNCVLRQNSNRKINLYVSFVEIFFVKRFSKNLQNVFKCTEENLIDR